VELRHQHFAGASLRLTQLMDDFKAKHAGYRGGGGGGNASLDMRQMRSLVQQLPQYRCAQGDFASACLS
jgi:syntaxin-binding protein 1